MSETNPIDRGPPSHRSTSDGLGVGMGVGRAVRAFSSVTFLSRIGGLIRDVLLVHVFGATAIGSAFIAGFAVPNTFRRLFGEGALAAAFIPEYVQANKHDPRGAARLASMTIAGLAAGTLLLTIVIELALGLTLLTLTPNPARDLSIRLVMVMLPFMPLICVAAILAGMLQAHGRFAAAASGPLVLNGFIIAVGVYHLQHGSHGGERTAYALGVAVVLSGLTQALSFAWMLRRHIQWTRDWSSERERLKRMFSRFVPVLIGLGAVQINTLLDTLIAMWPIWFGPTMFGHPFPLDAGSNVLLAAAQRLYQFPLGVFGVAVATAVFPLLARVADEPDRFVSTLRRGVRLSFFIALPASLGLVLVREESMRTFFSLRGRGFSSDEIVRAANVLAGYGAGVFAFSLNHVLTRAFYALGDTRTPVQVASAIVLLNLVLNWALIWPLREAGLAWATSACAIMQCVILVSLLRSKRSIRCFDRATKASIIRCTICTALMGVGVWLAGAIASRVIPSDWGWWAHASALASMCAAGGILYLLLSRAADAPELFWLTRRSAAEEESL